MRNEEDKLLQVPVKVTLGGKEYEVRPLPLKYALPWCKKLVAATVSGFVSRSNVTTDNPEAFDKAMSELLYDKPEQMIELFFEYARDLPRDEIEETATTAEVVIALEAVKELESRFFGIAIQQALAMMTTKPQ